MSASTPANAKSATQHIAAALARFTPAIQKEARTARRLLKKRMPTATELVYDNYNALVFGFGPSERASEAILSIALYPRWINLFFMGGPKLPDPQRVLRGSGTMVRRVLLEKASDLEGPALRALITAAIAKAKVALPTSGRGRTVLRAVSAKQRPRRPA
jgi:hypothetical protein